MDTRRLNSFVKFVDTGSLTRAADNLHVAQPALSQPVSALEAHFRQGLLMRSKRGVAPTEAGRALYRHAQIILRQMSQAQTAVSQATQTVAGGLPIGLASYSAGTALALPLLRPARERFHRIVLHVNEKFGGVLSELVMTGKMDMALIYLPGAIRGVTFRPMFDEELFLLSAERPPGGQNRQLALAMLKNVPLLLPSRIHTIRKAVDSAFERAGISPLLIAEIESAATLASAVDSGLGATTLPWSSACPSPPACSGRAAATCPSPGSPSPNCRCAFPSAHPISRRCRTPLPLRTGSSSNLWRAARSAIRCSRRGDEPVPTFGRRSEGPDGIAGRFRRAHGSDPPCVTARWLTGGPTRDQGAGGREIS